MEFSPLKYNWVIYFVFIKQFFKNLPDLIMFSHWIFIIKIFDVVGGCLLLRSFEALNLEFQVSRSFYFFTGGRLMYIYLHIDVAMCLFAIVEILKVTLIIIEKCKKH